MAWHPMYSVVDDSRLAKVDALDSQRSANYPLGIVYICRGKERCWDPLGFDNCLACFMIQADDPRTSEKILKDMMVTH